MNKQEILDVFIQAEKDWSKPVKTATQNSTHWGLCFYLRIQGFTTEEIGTYLEPHWLPYKTRGKSCFHFNGLGYEPQGRKERLDVIRRVITHLKNS